MTDLPTTRSDWSSIGRGIRETLTRPGYLPLALVAALVVATLLSTSRRLSFVADVLLAGDLPVALKAELLLLHLPFVGGWPDGIPDVAALLVAAIAGLTVAILVEASAETDHSSEHESRRDAGLVLGTLAVLVAACGPGMLAGISGLADVAGLAGADGIPASLPLGGVELSVLAVPAMALAIHWMVGDVGAPDGT